VTQSTKNKNFTHSDYQELQFGNMWITLTYQLSKLWLCLPGVGSRFCGTWRSHNFWNRLWEKNTKITNTKLGTKVNICFEKEKALKQISDLKKYKNTINIKKSRN